MPLPLLAIGLGLGAAGAAAGVGGALGGVGKNKFQATAPEINKNDYRFGGERQQTWNVRGEQMQRRDAPKTNYWEAEKAREQGQQARDLQLRAANMYQDAAMGNAPSVAQNQMQAGIEASQRAQASAAAGTRGGLARASANRTAMLAGGDMAAQAVNQSAQLRAAEMAQARAGYAQAAGNLRGSDLSQQGQDASQSQFLTEAELKQRQLNDNMTGQAWGLGQRSEEVQQQGLIDYNRQKSANEMGSQQINAGVANQNAQTQADMFNRAVGAVTGMGSSMAGGGLTQKSDENAKENIKPANPKLQKFLDVLKSYEYDYKEPEKDGEGKRVSVMAQDLEKSELGDKMVKENSDGMKYVDYGKGFSTMLASQAYLNDRLNNIEDMFHQIVSKKGK